MSTAIRVAVDGEHGTLISQHPDIRFIGADVETSIARVHFPLISPRNFFDGIPSAGIP